MLFQQGVAGGASVVCSIPALASGVPSWTQPTVIQFAVNGGGRTGAASTITSTDQPAGTSPWIANLAISAADLSTLGEVQFFLLDASSNIVGILQGIVLTQPDPVLGAAGTSIPAFAAGSANGLLINGTNNGVVVFNNSWTWSGGVTIQAGLFIANGGGPGIDVLTGGGNFPAIQLSGAGTAPAIICTGGVTGPAVKLVGGGTSGAGLLITTTLGDGIEVTPGDGNALKLLANGSNTHGLLCTGGTGGVSDGALFQAGTGGKDLVAASGLSGVLLAAAGVDAITIESGIVAGPGLVNDSAVQLTEVNLRQTISVIAALLLGAESRSGSTVRDPQLAVPGGIDRIVATVATGGRSGITLTVPD
jgi:hypothetical protein